MRDDLSTDLTAAAYLTREDGYDERPDPSEYEERPRDLPPATRRCWDCGVGSGPCVCTREYVLWEAEQELRDEEEQEWLAYVDRLLPVARPTDDQDER